MNTKKTIAFCGLIALASLPFGCNSGGETPETTGGTGGAGKMTSTGGRGADDEDGGGATTTAGRGTGTPATATAAGGMTGMGMTGMGATGTGSAAAAPSGPVNRAKPMITTFGMKKGNALRDDPFLITWRNPPPPPYVFESVEPIRVASADIRTPPAKDTVVNEVPTMRVSGIMSGDGVYAILEGGSGEPEIVKPGSTTREGYRVISINSDSVKLQRRQGNLLLTQVVPLTDVPAGTQTAIFGGGFQGGQGGAMGRPGGGLPGVGSGGAAGGKGGAD